MSTTGVEPQAPAPVAAPRGRATERGIPALVVAAPRRRLGLPALVLPARRHHLRPRLRRPDRPVVLLQPDPVDAVHDRVHRAGQLRPVLQGAVADERRPEHDRLRGRDERPQGRHRAPPRDPPHLAPPQPQRAAVGHLLPGPGEHRRGGHHVRRPDASVDRPDQPIARGRRDRRSAVARPTRTSPCSRSPSSTSGRASASRSSSSSPGSCRSRRSTSMRPGSRAAPG